MDILLVILFILSTSIFLLFFLITLDLTALWHILSDLNTFYEDSIIKIFSTINKKCAKILHILCLASNGLCCH